MVLSICMLTPSSWDDVSNDLRQLVQVFCLDTYWHYRFHTAYLVPIALVVGYQRLSNIEVELAFMVILLAVLAYCFSLFCLATVTMPSIV